MAALDVSEPLAGIVEITPTGIASVISAFPSKKSHTSLWYGMPTETALAVSTELPPPTARIKSTCFCFPISTNVLTNSTFGLGTTLPFAKNSIPRLLQISSISW